VLLLSSGCAEEVFTPQEPPELRFAGFCYTAYQHDAFRQGAARGALQELSERTRARWVAISVFEYQSTAASADIAPNTSGRNPLTGEPWATSSTEEDIRAAVADARRHGLACMLKPHVDCYSGEWRGSIRPDSAWFRAYTAMLLRYARLAQELGIEMLCIGTELVTATQPQYTTFWERLIDTVRRVYGGWLLYAANWEGTPELPGPEFVRIRFWHRLDFVGVNFYPPLTSAPEEPPPPMEQALGRWQRLVEAIAELARAVGRPVILAEVGCPSVEGALAAPWDWRRTQEPNARADLHAQEFYYEAVRSAFQGRPWLAGIFWWEWESIPSRTELTGYTPRGKPAERVVREWFRSPRSALLRRELADVVAILRAGWTSSGQGARTAPAPRGWAAVRADAARHGIPHTSAPALCCSSEREHGAVPHGCSTARMSLECRAVPRHRWHMRG